MTSWHQLLLAVVFLTRLPLERIMPKRIMPLAGSTWAFPLVGALVGGVSSLPLLLDGPKLLLAMVSLLIGVALTGALHEDALADFADAAGGSSRDQRLDIMHDSHIGSYGVMALIIACGFRVIAISELSPHDLIIAAACGRAAIVLTMGALLPVRRDGLSYAVGSPGVKNVLIATSLAALILVFGTAGWVWPLIAGLAATSFIIWRARKWLNGQSGDVLGSASIVTETAMLAAMALAH